jgi:transcription initiation factor IIE alpha subunit
MVLYISVKDVKDRPIMGYPIDANGNRIEIEESDRYYICPICGQSVDEGNLMEVFYHDQEDHKPIAINS